MKIIGIAIGGTKSAVTLADINENSINIIKKLTFITPANDEDALLKDLYHSIDSLKNEFSFISVISGGPLDIKKGTINNPPHLPGLKNTPIVSLLKDRYKCPVALLNDADACAFAEYKYGAGKGKTNFAFVTFGTGIGTGLILNNKLYLGNNGMAGEIGHVQISDDGPLGYGKKGSVEGWCAGGNIPLWAKIENVNTAKEIFDLYRKGDKSAVQVISTLIDKLGQSLSILIDVLNLDSIALGGIYFRNTDILEKPLYNSLKKHCLSSNLKNCEIVPSSLKDNIDDYSSLMGYFI